MGFSELLTVKAKSTSCNVESKVKVKTVVTCLNARVMEGALKNGAR